MAAALRYEVTFKGEAGAGLRVAFEDFAISTGHGVAFGSQHSLRAYSVGDERGSGRAAAAQ